MSRDPECSTLVLVLYLWLSVIMLLLPQGIEAEERSPGGMAPASDQEEQDPGAARVQGHSMSWWTVDGGGGASASGAYRFSATIAQPDPGTLAASGMTISGGYWAAYNAQQVMPLFADGFEFGDTSGWSGTVSPSTRRGASLEPEGGE